MADYLFFLNDSLTVNIVFIALSLFVISKAAELLVHGISSYAAKFRMSDYITGFVIVAMAASMPEIISSFVGYTINQSGIFLGTILGTNMVHSALVMGVLISLKDNLSLDSEMLAKSRLWIYGILMVPMLMMLFNGFTRTDGIILTRLNGIILVACFLIYTIISIRREGNTGKLQSVALKHLWKDVFIFLGALAALLFAGFLLVNRTVFLADAWSIPAYFLAITIIGVGSALPDFAVSLKSVLKGHNQIGVGDVIGSTLIELVLFFGLIAIWQPVVEDFSIVMPAVLALIVSMTILMYLTSLKNVKKWHGFALLLVYASFIAFEAWKLF